MPFYLPACSSIQEVVCSGAEGLWSHRETHQVVLSNRSEKHPGQVHTHCTISSPITVSFLKFWHDPHMCFTVLFFPLSSPSVVVVVWPQCTEGSDALPGESCQGLPAEWAGGSVIQDGPAERPADRVRGHGSETQRGCWHAQGNAFIIQVSLWIVKTRSSVSHTLTIRLLLCFFRDKLRETKK